MLQSDNVGTPDKATMLLADIDSPGLQTRGTDYMDFENATIEKRWLWIEGTHYMRGTEKKGCFTGVRGAEIYSSRAAQV